MTSSHSEGRQWIPLKAAKAARTVTHIIGTAGSKYVRNPDSTWTRTKNQELQQLQDEQAAKGIISKQSNNITEAKTVFVPTGSTPSKAGYHDLTHTASGKQVRIPSAVYKDGAVHVLKGGHPNPEYTLKGIPFGYHRVETSDHPTVGHSPIEFDESGNIRHIGHPVREIHYSDGSSDVDPNAKPISEVIDSQRRMRDFV
jgi:hypothetical protein